MRKTFIFTFFSVGHFYVLVFVKLLRENFVRLKEEAKQTSFGFLYTDSDAEAAPGKRGLHAFCSFYGSQSS